MSNRRRQFNLHKLLGTLFVCSLTFCLWLGYLPTTVQQLGKKAIATSQSPSLIQLVDQGVEFYHQNQFLWAIDAWKPALDIAVETNDQANAAIVRDYLARAYQQIGQINQSISYWEEIIPYYHKIEAWQKQGRMMTELAQAYSSIGQYRQAIVLLCGSLDTNQNSNNDLSTEVNQKLSCQQESALPIARTQGDKQGEVAALGSLGNALRLKGDYERAIECLQTSLGISSQETDFQTSTPRIKDCGIENLISKNQTEIIPEYQSQAYINLGNAYFSQAQRWDTFAESARIRGADDQKFTQTADYNYQQAQQYYQNSLEIARNNNQTNNQIRVVQNLIKLDYQTRELVLDNKADQDKILTTALNLFNKLPDSRQKAYTAINLASLKQSPIAQESNLLNNSCPTRILGESNAKQLLEQAVAIAENLQDYRSQSFALGELANIYECRQDYEQALDITNQARAAADQNLIAKDSLYLWEWQAARILHKLGQESEAIAAYERAIDALEGKAKNQGKENNQSRLLMGGIRGELITAERGLQFDFRDNIAALYREFAQLNLELADQLPMGDKQRNLEVDAALKTIDSLKLAELQNYFGQDCVLTLVNEKPIEQLVKEDTAIFTSVIFPDKTAILVNLPQGKDGRREDLTWINFDSETLGEEVTKFRQKLTKLRDRSNPFFEPAQEFYNLIIEPFVQKGYLDPKQIKTLVFIPDGILRSIPMNALYDGEKFLVEKYAIATTPRFQISTSKENETNREDTQILAFGLTQESIVNGENFFPLGESVETEINNLKSQFPETTVLLDDDFTPQTLQTELKKTNYPIIHIATHAKFGTIPEDTFLVTGKNQKLTITQLERDIRRFSNSSETGDLLALTACETAVGDDRATLGLAGIAAQAGVRSVIASLWSIPSNYTTELITKFYQNWQSGKMSKARALQEAQKEFIQGNCQDNRSRCHPVTWAPFILIGNWL
ncbi:MAG: CHAT domain-containing protein [Symploca sp. SIO1C4]|uniref:CHAT domain-containing protein n=1 Tax=Symploca sp. SIO1C4 TaxID=2607765 RepID=A0A6B3N6E8_9CYAN|nr:CHAT domain-containing protein [Symploca sp. SIO1C4]